MSFVGAWELQGVCGFVRYALAISASVSEAAQTNEGELNQPIGRNRSTQM